MIEPLAAMFKAMGLFLSPGKTKKRIPGTSEIIYLKTYINIPISSQFWNTFLKVSARHSGAQMEFQHIRDGEARRSGVQGHLRLHSLRPAWTTRDLVSKKKKKRKKIFQVGKIVFS